LFCIASYVECNLFDLLADFAVFVVKENAFTFIAIYFFETLQNVER